jgi:hypothetical protein
VLTLKISAIWLNVEKIKKTCSHYNFMSSANKYLSFLLNFVIEPTGQKQVLSHKYPYYHNKGAGGVCQVSFFVSMLSATCMTPFVVNSLFLDFLVYLVYLFCHSAKRIPTE